MVDQKNHSFTSNSKLRRLALNWLLFILPVLVIILAVEYAIANVEYSETVKLDYIERNGEEIEIMFLGSSQVQRAVNPEYLSKPAVNLANRSQLLHEDFQLLKHFKPQLPNLKLVVLEVGYDKLERNKSHTSPILDHKNLKIYGVNTFGRNQKIQDHFLFHSGPAYFTERLSDYLSGSSKIKLNEHGFDENKFEGSYNNSNSIVIDNVKDEEAFEDNLQLLHEVIRYCSDQNLKVLIYHPPTHTPYNELRDPELLKKWQQLLSELKNTYPKMNFFIQDTSSIFEREDFYNANHLNPRGAKKASKQLDEFLISTYYNNSASNDNVTRKEDM